MDKCRGVDEEKQVFKDSWTDLYFFCYKKKKFNLKEDHKTKH